MSPETIFAFKSLFLFFLGMIILYYSSEIIINNAIIISNNYNISKLFVGLVILALGTSLPELFVSIVSSIKGNNSVAIGNIVGSNIANIGLVFGFSLLLQPIIFKSNSKDSIFNLSILMISSVLIIFFLRDNYLIRSEGLFLLFICLLYFFILTKYFSKSNLDDDQISKSSFKAFSILLINFIMLYFGSESFVTGALGIAEIIGLNDLIVGMTIVSLGTSAPEIFTTISAYKRRESNLIIGNIMGSNIINILLVGGVLGLISRVQVDFSNMFYHNSILLFLTLLFIIVIVSLKKMGRFLGIIFISIYLIFIYLNFVIA